MLLSAKSLTGHKLHSLDGNLGSIKDFYFDDKYWTIRYLVANTGNWLTGRKVLISPYSVTSVNASGEVISVELTKAQVEASPSMNSEELVSRQFEESYNGYYGYPGYWDGPYAWGNYPYLERDRGKRDRVARTAKKSDSHLRSTHLVTGYHLQALDGRIGHVEDFVIDDETWTIRYLIVATNEFWPGRKVLLSPQWIRKISWEESQVVIDLSRETIKGSPAYIDGSLPTRDEETILYDYYNLPAYWQDESLYV